ncbi:MAG: sensor histidine kinase [Usitatibacter sp.]
MSTPRPFSRQPVNQPIASAGAAQPLAELTEEISAKLAQAEAHSSPEARKTLAEARALVAQQGSLLSALEDRIRELASLSHFLQIHAEREKALLARELHDALGGILTPAKMDLAWLETRLGAEPETGERIRRLGSMIDSGIDLKRRIIENLHPSLLDHLGLASALQWYVEEACRAAGIECRLMVSERLERLGPDLEIALYRLVQESVSNIVRHAQARVLQLSLERTEDGLTVEIADDGVGIANIEEAKRASHGLAGMRHRVRSVGGTFDVQSLVGKGTRIDVFVPLRKK